MISGKEIAEAKEVLHLPERASIAEIKASYRTLLKQWHPDKCGGDKAECNEMTQKITAAYKLIMLYCSQYKFPFTQKEIEQHVSDEEWWAERFGHDPLWGRH
ncbi:MAG: DnaJ domain-containing protein [Candidatus Electronema aureum]|uniref:DnaJ domain-containing protein n=1 Tax=Candidatus Electronema aureum TaxID=2005002 RepID=A0A521G0L1_9BACT|nr:MAG: DnaJ domain-containing protein [Candidatus Electronema aureum]